MFTPRAFVRSAKPVRRRTLKQLSIARALDRDHVPLTPGLRPRPDHGEVPGFHQPFVRGGDDDETTDQRR